MRKADRGRNALQGEPIGHDLTESQDAILLQRRARRRLVGAIALVVLTVIVLPILFDREPRSMSQDLVISIPSQDSKFNPRPLQPERVEPAKTAVLPVERPAATPTKPAEEPAKAVASAPVAEKPHSDEPVKAAKTPAEVKPAKDEPVRAASKSGSAEKDAVAAASKADSRSDQATAQTKAQAEAQRAKKALEGEQFVVLLGAYTSRENIKQLQAKVSAAGFKTYTEKAPKGDQLRVRAGPFPTREAAEQARKKLSSRGLPAGAVTPL